MKQNTTPFPSSHFDELVDRRGTGSVKWDKYGDISDLLPLWVADMDFRTAPAVEHAVAQRAAHPVYGYTQVGNDYFEAVTSWFSRRHRWTIDPRHLIYTTGVLPAIACALRATTLPGERVATLTPAYNCFFSSISNSGCQLADVPLKREDVAPGRFTYRIDWQLFEEALAHEKTTAFLLCNPHNPGGRVWNKEEMEHMSQLCHRHNVAIISDEIHCELTMPGTDYVPMATVDDSAIVLTSPSKAFNIAGLQAANIWCKDDVMRRRIDRAVNIHEVCDLNAFGPVALIAAYNESEDWLDGLRAYLKGNYDLLCDVFDRHLPHLPLSVLEGTYLVWVDITKTGLTADVLMARLLHHAHVQVSSGSIYGDQRYLRLNIATQRSRLEEALQRMIKELKI